eukprot:Skav229794  [mRNA]  locus=scaffold567:1363:1860:+ [translate_table: standard]
MQLKKDGPLVYCYFERQLQEKVYTFDFEESLNDDIDILTLEKPKTLGRLAIRSIPAPLVLRCDFSLADCRHFEAICFNLAGREIARVQADARLSLTMDELAQIIKDVALEYGMLQSQNQEVRVLLNGSESVLAKETFLFDWLRHSGRSGQKAPPDPDTIRKRKAP